MIGQLRSMGGAPGNPALGTTVGCGLSNYQAATAQIWALDKQSFPLRINNYCRVPTPIRSSSPFSDPCLGLAAVGAALFCGRHESAQAGCSNDSRFGDIGP